MSKDILKYIVINALEEQKRVAVAINREAVKAAFRSNEDVLWITCKHLT